MRPIENLKIDDMRIHVHDECPNGVICIDWSANIGWGRYDLVLEDDGMLHAYTEYMDRGEDKEFTKAILAKLVDKIVVEE